MSFGAVLRNWENRAEEMELVMPILGHLQQWMWTPPPRKSSDHSRGEYRTFLGNDYAATWLLLALGRKFYIEAFTQHRKPNYELCFLDEIHKHIILSKYHSKSITDIAVPPSLPVTWSEQLGGGDCITISFMFIPTV